MSKETTLAELAERRERFKDFRDSVDADLKRQRAERLAAEEAAIVGLVLQAAAEDATMGQIKRAYNTKDHRTISTIVRSHTAEIEALRSTQIAALKGQPEWFSIDGNFIHVMWEGGTADYTWSSQEDGQFLFTTDEPRWDETFTVENKAVTLLDGKTETDSNEARVVAKFIRKSRTQ